MLLRLCKILFFSSVFFASACQQAPKKYDAWSAAEQTTNGEKVTYDKWGDAEITSSLPEKEQPTVVGPKAKEVLVEKKTHPKYTVHIGSFKISENADKLQDHLKKNGFSISKKKFSHKKYGELNSLAVHKIQSLAAAEKTALDISKFYSETPFYITRKKKFIKAITSPRVRQPSSKKNKPLIRP